MRLGHVALMVRDVDVMVDFYVSTVGLQVSDRGREAGRDDGPEMVFLSWDPPVLHHQMALLAVRRDCGLSNSVHHVAFEVDELSRVWTRVKPDRRATSLDPGCVGPATAFQHDQWSIRFRDPEGNGAEVYAPTPWDARASHGRYSTSKRPFEEFDIDADDATLLAWGRAQLVGVEHCPRNRRPWPPSVERRLSLPSRSTRGRSV